MHPLKLHRPTHPSLLVVILGVHDPVDSSKSRIDHPTQGARIILLESGIRVNRLLVCGNFRK